MIPKFRAWDKKTKKIYNLKRLDFEGEYVTLDGPFLYNELRYFNSIELMQYTGLEDKNGKEIWERDRVKIKGKKGEYEIAYCCGSFSAFKIDGRGAIDLMDLEKLHSEVEVIGTAYDPERPFNRVSL